MDDRKKVLDSLEFSVLTDKEREFIDLLIERLHLSVQNTRKVAEAAVDLRLWQQDSIIELFELEDTGGRSGKTKSRFLLYRFFDKITSIRSKEISYQDFTPPLIKPAKSLHVTKKTAGTILGRCPVAGERTRCCNLQTLDAVTQCSFGCSYCSIQSFYDKNRVYIRNDLAKRLSEIEIDEDTIYHIGTGQSSDSLLLGNRDNLLGDLFSFAAEHPNVILELKSKASGMHWLDELEVPKNVLATWSVNSQTIIENEEHLTSSLEHRLQAARQAADCGLLVGFHFHPMVYHAFWREEYGKVVDSIMDRFSPEEVVLISLGTLTFIRPVIKQLRTSGRSTRVTQIPLQDAAGKYSYPLEVKKELFSFVYDRFSRRWKEEVFFYLCMEDPSLWPAVFGYEYTSNDQFEQAMKTHYMKRIDRLRVSEI